MPTAPLCRFRRALRSSTAPLAAAALVAAISACSHAPAASPTLFDALGGKPGIDLFVGHTLDRMSTDPRTKRSFDGVNLAYLKRSIAAHTCEVAGGPDCGYDGETIAHAHADLKIGGAEFDAMVGILREEIDEAGVGAAAKNELLRRLAPSRRDVVTAGITR